MGGVERQNDSSPPDRGFLHDKISLQEKKLDPPSCHLFRHRSPFYECSLHWVLLVFHPHHDRRALAHVFRGRTNYASEPKYWLGIMHVVLLGHVPSPYMYWSFAG